MALLVDYSNFFCAVHSLMSKKLTLEIKGVRQGDLLTPKCFYSSLAVRLSGRGPGTFSNVSDVMDRANYTNVGGM